MQVDLTKIIGLFSNERFEAYRRSGESDQDAFARAKWNTALSEALYPSLHAIEVGYRNRLHECIANVMGNTDWILNPPFLYDSEKEILQTAKDALRVRGKSPTTGYLIAELKFGFWTSLADARYDTMWPKIIRCVFPFMPKTIRTRGEISKRLNRVRRLRNATSHHHSIWHWGDLEDHHSNIYSLMEWMEPDYANSVRPQDRFLAVLKAGHEKFLG
jgi:hypothetical protein